MRYRILFPLLLLGAVCALCFTNKSGDLVQGKEWDTCFRPQQDCEAKTEDFLASADQEILLAAYDLRHKGIGRVLMKKLEKGVTVKIVVDPSKARKKKSIVFDLIDAGAKVHFGIQEGHQHNKFMIVDGKKMQTGSTNYANHSFRINQENQLYTSNREVVAAYRSYYKELWENHSSSDMPRDDGGGSRDPDVDADLDS